MIANCTELEKSWKVYNNESVWTFIGSGIIVCFILWKMSGKSMDFGKIIELFESHDLLCSHKNPRHFPNS